MAYSLTYAGRASHSRREVSGSIRPEPGRAARTPAPPVKPARAGRRWSARGLDEFTNAGMSEDSACNRRSRQPHTVQRQAQSALATTAQPGGRAHNAAPATSAPPTTSMTRRRGAVTSARSWRNSAREASGFVTSGVMSCLSAWQPRLVDGLVRSTTWRRYHALHGCREPDVTLLLEYAQAKARHARELPSTGLLQAREGEGSFVHGDSWRERANVQGIDGTLRSLERPTEHFPETVGDLLPTMMCEAQRERLSVERTPHS